MQRVSKFSEYSDDVITFNHIKFENCEEVYFPAQTHDVWEMIFLKEGDLNYTIEGNIYKVKSQSLILTRPGYTHFLQLNDRTVYDRYDILFDAGIVHSALCKKIPKDLHIAVFDKPNEVFVRFKKIDCYSEHLEEELVGNMLHHLIEEIFCDILVSERLLKIEKEEVFIRNEMLIKAIDYIKENIGKSFTLEELCGELYVSKGYLHKIFKQNFDISPKKYILSKRLAKAQRAIIKGKKPTEIYSECGFEDYSVFYRNYKKTYGYAPSDELKVKKIREIQS